LLVIAAVEKDLGWDWGQGKGVHIGNVINMDEMPEKSKRNETYQQTTKGYSNFMPRQLPK